MNNDTIYMGKGSSSVYGGKGDDTIYAGKGSGFASGDLGNNTLVEMGTQGDYTLTQEGGQTLIHRIDGSQGDLLVQGFQTIDYAPGAPPAPPSGGGGGDGGNPPPAPPTPAAGKVLLEDGDTVEGTFNTIQAAVNAATLNGETINVGTGTFQEQVTDNTGLQLTLQGQGEGKTTIESPDAASLAANETAVDSPRPDKYAVVGVGNNSALTISGLTIDGRDQGNIPDPNAYDFTGIDGTDATVNTTNVDVTGIQETPGAGGAPSGNQRNTGIILDDNDGIARTDSLTSTSVEQFQKNGIADYGTGLTVNLASDIITGAGDINSTAQNGIEFLSGATGSVTGSTFSGIGYTGGGTTATDILTEGASSAFTVANNLITGGPASTAAGGSLGVYLEGTNSGFITGNQFTNLAQGIDDEPNAGQANATISGNKFSNVTTTSNV